VRVLRKDDIHGRLTTLLLNSVVEMALLFLQTISINKPELEFIKLNPIAVLLDLQN
jgi:hypothetical protein